MKNKTFPCPYCTRLGESPITQGDCIDVGDETYGRMMLQIAPDELCGGCDGEGFIPVGSENHFYIKYNSLCVTIGKMFGDVFLDNLSEELNNAFWKNIEQAFNSIKSEWLKYEEAEK